MSAVFISHRMHEILSVADRTTVMRSGATIQTVDREAATPELLVALMTGRTESAAHTTTERAHADGPELLIASDVRLRPDAEPLEMSIRAGEIVGVAGLEGHGQQELLLALAGFVPVAGAIESVRPSDGRRVTISSAHQAYSQGVVYVPRDRRKASIFAARSIADNFAVATLSRDARAGVYRNSSARNRLERYKDALRIRMSSPDAAITTLSGGNQQKVILARWLAAEPSVLLLNDPTRGVDLAAKRDIHRILRERTRQGTAVVVVSSEVDEILQLVDRCLVMREGTISADLARSELSEERLVAAYFGEGAPR